VCDWGTRIPHSLNDMKVAIHADLFGQMESASHPVSVKKGGSSLQATSRGPAVPEDKDEGGGEGGDPEDKDEGGGEGGDPAYLRHLVEITTHALGEVLMARRLSYKELMREVEGAYSDDPHPPSGATWQQLQPNIYNYYAYKHSNIYIIPWWTLQIQL